MTAANAAAPSRLILPDYTTIIKTETVDDDVSLLVHFFAGRVFENIQDLQKQINDFKTTAKALFDKQTSKFSFSETTFQQAESVLLKATKKFEADAKYNVEETAQKTAADTTAKVCLLFPNQKELASKIHKFITDPKNNLRLTQDEADELTGRLSHFFGDKPLVKEISAIFALMILSMTPENYLIGYDALQIAALIISEIAKDVFDAANLSKSSCKQIWMSPSDKTLLLTPEDKILLERIQANKPVTSKLSIEIFKTIAANFSASIIGSNTLEKELEGLLKTAGLGADASPEEVKWTVQVIESISLKSQPKVNSEATVEAQPQSGAAAEVKPLRMMIESPRFATIFGLIVKKFA